jgi:hypothetical protein
MATCIHAHYRLSHYFVADCAYLRRIYSNVCLLLTLQCCEQEQCRLNAYMDLSIVHLRHPAGFTSSTQHDYIKLTCVDTSWVCVWVRKEAFKLFKNQDAFHDNTNCTWDVHVKLDQTSHSITDARDLPNNSAQQLAALATGSSEISKLSFAVTKSVTDGLCLILSILWGTFGIRGTR